MSKLSVKALFLLFSCCLFSSIVQGQDCVVSGDIDLVGDGTLFLRQVIDPTAATVSVELEYMGIGWVGFAFSSTQSMVPNTAIIGLPDAGTVQKYDLTARDISGVNPSSAARQTLTNVAIVQDATSTTLSFTRALEETDETTVLAGSNTILVAYGSSNTLAQHIFRLPTTAEFTLCAAAAPVATPTGAPVASPTAAPVAVPVVTPVDAPVEAPEQEPVSSPAETPTADDSGPTVSPAADAPVPSVGGYPVAAPTNATAPVGSNVTTPVKTPVKSPVQAPAPTSSGITIPSMSTFWMMMACVVFGSIMMV